MEHKNLKLLGFLSLLVLVSAGGPAEESKQMPSSWVPSSSANIYTCINDADAFKDGKYVKTYCLVRHNLTFDDADDNCKRLGYVSYEPLSIEDPLFFFMNGDKAPYDCDQVFITKTEDIDPEYELYCTGYIFFRGLWQKSAVDCKVPSYSFCQYTKSVAPSNPTIIVPTTPAPARA